MLPFVFAAFPFAQTTPYAKPLIVLYRPLQAQQPHLALGAHLLCVSCGATFFRKKHLRIGLRAQSLVLPCEILVRPKETPQFDLRFPLGIIKYSPHTPIPHPIEYRSGRHTQLHTTTHNK